MTAVGIAVRALGAFEVTVDGVAVPATAWQSKKARDLLKLLIVHRGRPVQRDVLIEALWPDADEVDLSRLGNRLSVALSTLRSVLEASQAAEHRVPPFVTTDGSVRLSPDLAVDVDRFLDHVRAARLEEAVALYGGEFLPDDIYADWSVSVREEARIAYVGALHGLAKAAAQAGDNVGTAALCARILDADPYDDAGHRMLIGALEGDGRHGEARRSYERFAARLEELGLVAPPFDVVTGAL